MKHMRRLITLCLIVINFIVLAFSLVFEDIILDSVPLVSILEHWLIFMIIMGIMSWLILGFIFFKLENEKARIRVSNIKRVLYYENENVMLEKKFFFEASTLGSYLLLYRAPLHSENHEFKSREKLAPMGNSQIYEMSSIAKNLDQIAMKAITEEDPESRIASRLNSGKKMSIMERKLGSSSKKSNFELDFNRDELSMKMTKSNQKPAKTFVKKLQNIKEEVKFTHKAA